MIISSFSLFASTKSFYLTNDRSSDCYIRALESKPEGKKIIADYFFFIGYGDRADNHKPLFDELNDKGIRVLSYDYPSHGLTRCGELNHNNYSTLMSFAEQLERQTREDVKRPVILSGWSTGGLLALRLAQTQKFSERTIQSLVLIAPGLSVYVLVGGDGIIRDSTLTSNPNPPHMGPPQPISPLLTPLFSSTLIANGILARQEGLPNIPTLMFIAGNKKDSYAKTSELKEFAKEELKKGSSLKAFQCKNSMHEMDNEIESIASFVRSTIVNFSLNPLETLKASAECRSF
jgi:hypothetical protein